MALLRLKNKVSNINNLISKFADISPLIARMALGWVFFWAGFGKLGHLDQVISYFDSLGIPLPHLQAPFVAALEFVGGGALVVGFATRYFSILLTGTMAVALMTAHSGDIEKISDAFKIYEFVYILVFTFLITHGPGRLSIDSLLKKWV